MIIKISKNIKIKKEEQRGKIFNETTGDIIELDNQAYNLIKEIQNFDIVDTNYICKIYPQKQKEKIESVITELIKLGILIKMPNGILAKQYNNKVKDYLENNHNEDEFMNSIDVVHFAITFRCNNNCPDCYMRRHEFKYNKELNLNQIEQVICKIKEAGVFALAIGGGEPFLRKDIKEILKISHEKGLTNYVTTGMYDVQSKTIIDIVPYIKVLQIGIKVDQNGQIQEEEKLIKLVNILNENNITYGANLVLNKTVINKLDKTIENIIKTGFTNITLIRYKPPKDIKRWMKEVPDEYDFKIAEQEIKEIINKNSKVKFRFDCGLSFIQRKVDSKLAKKNGYKGCNAGKSIISVSPDGSVFPCSQLVGESFCAGNLLNESFEEIYNSEVLKKYRNFRNLKSFKQSKCGKCMYNEKCGDCRVLSQDSMNKEIGCYDPIYPEKYKRKLLKMYEDEEDLYDPIGYTSGGAPFVTREQWQQWQDEYTLKNYPRWLLNNKDKEDFK